MGDCRGGKKSKSSTSKSSGGAVGGGLAPATIGVKFERGLSPQQVDAHLTILSNERERIRSEWQSMLQKLGTSFDTQQELISEMNKINKWYEDAIGRIDEINRKFRSEYGVGL